jgi:hypothetical protein
MVRSAVEACSFRELARRLGVSDRAVRKAVRFDRLKRSVREDRKGIADVALALVEWRENAGAQAARRSALKAEAETLPPVSLEDLAVDRQGDQVFLLCRVSGPPDSDDPGDFAALELSKDVAANLGLRLWIQAGGQLEDLPGMSRQREARELAAALRAAAARVEN